MKSMLNIKKAVFVALLAMGIQVAYAAFSFTGIADEKTRTSKFSLHNLNALNHKGLSFTSVRSAMQFKPQYSSKENVFGSETTSMMRFDNGNTTYVMPYKFKIKAPRFKTPAPQQH